MDKHLKIKQRLLSAYPYTTFIRHRQKTFIRLHRNVMIPNEERTFIIIFWVFQIHVVYLKDPVFSKESFTYMSIDKNVSTYEILQNVLCTTKKTLLFDDWHYFCRCLTVIRSCYKRVKVVVVIVNRSELLKITLIKFQRHTNLQNLYLFNNSI
jgi:hypothetical protein